MTTKNGSKVLFSALVLVLVTPLVLSSTLFAQPNQESFGQAVGVRANDDSNFWIGNPTGHDQFALVWLFESNGDLSEWFFDPDPGDTGEYHTPGCQGVFLAPHASSGEAINMEDGDTGGRKDVPSLAISISIPTDPAFNAAFDDAGTSRRRPFGHANRAHGMHAQFTIKPEHMEVTDDMLECGCCELYRLCEESEGDFPDDCLGLLRNVGDGISESECQNFVEAEGGCPTNPNEKPTDKPQVKKRIAGRQ